MRDEKESEQQKYSSPTNAEKEISPFHNNFLILMPFTNAF